jgi:hypothetical protein
MERRVEAGLQAVSSAGAPTAGKRGRAGGAGAASGRAKVTAERRAAIRPARARDSGKPTWLPQRGQVELRS